MLIKHLRDDSRKPFATLVADENSVGVAICHSNDQFNKKMGIKIASGRLFAGSGCKVPQNHFVLHGGMPIELGSLINGEIALLQERAERYFKKEERSCLITALLNFSKA